MKIYCEFEYGKWSGSPEREVYTCIATMTSITEPETVIKDFVGEHFIRHNNNDVEAIYFLGTVVEFLPRGIDKIFPSLKYFSIENCGLKTIVREDFKGFEKLKLFYAPSNQLKSLPSNLFEGMHHLKHISFHNNKLEFINSMLLKPLLKDDLKYLNFCDNPAIDVMFQSTDLDGITLEDLMSIIDASCSVANYKTEAFPYSFTKGFADLRSANRFLDFIIVSGKREFHVHKAVLAVHSRVIGEMIEDKVKASDTGRLEILGVTEESVAQLVDYIYTGKIPEDCDGVELLTLAARYEIENLQVLCEEIILKNIDYNNAFQIYSLARVFMSETLMAKAIDVIKKAVPDKKVEPSMINDPGRLQEVVQVVHDRKRKHQEVEEEFNNRWKKLKTI